VLEGPAFQRFHEQRNGSMGRAHGGANQKSVLIPRQQGATVSRPTVRGADRHAFATIIDLPASAIVPY
jgi:hypothetical protein